MSAPSAAGQLPDLPDPVPVPTITPPRLPDPLPVPDLPEVPTLPVPVPAPDVPDVPEVPTVPALPRVTAPSDDGPDPAPRASSPSGGSATGESAGGPASGGSAGGGSAAGGSEATAAGPQTTGGNAPARRTPAVRTRARSAGRTPAPAERRARRDRRLRRTVEQLSGCLDELAAGQRRVLVLRAGVGPRRPQTRRAVAQRLDTTLRRVARTERRGLRELRSAARAGRCGATTGLLAAAAAGGGSATTTVPADREAAGADRGGDATPVGRTGVKDESRTVGPPDRPETRVPAAGAEPTPPILLLLAAAFLVGFAVVRTLERVRHHGGHAA